MSIPTRPTPAPATTPPTIAFDDFLKVDLRVAKVVHAEAIAGTKKLLRLELDVGDGRPRQVVSGLAEAYAPAALVGRSLIYLANLAPRAIRGVTSEGMILAAGDEQVLGLSAVDVDVPPGTQIR